MNRTEINKLINSGNTNKAAGKWVEAFNDYTAAYRLCNDPIIARWAKEMVIKQLND